MEQGYPLQAYHGYNSNDINFSGHIHPSPLQHDSSIPSSSLPFGNLGHARYATSRGYEPLGGADTGYEPYLPHSRAKPGFFTLLNLWLLEISACLLTIGSLVAIVVVLRIYDGHSITEIHLPVSLTLNGIVAALSTLSRVALMIPVGSALTQESWTWFSDDTKQHRQYRSRLKDFQLSDDASRSVWGSILFLLFARRRYIAYMGAFATIISLAFGTFTQQLISIDQFEVSDLNSHLIPGNLPRAETWQYYNAVPSEFSLTLPFSIRAAVFNGILSSRIDPITVSCPTGNCTWPVTPSLAVCGECSPSGYEQSCNQRSCNYTMASGSTYTLDNSGNGGVGFVVAVNSGGGIYNLNTTNRLYLTQFDVVGSPYKSLAQSFHNEGTNASECALWICVQSYNVRMAAGELQQDVTMEFSTLIQPPNEVFNDGSSVFANYTFADLPAEMNPSPDVTYNISKIGLSSFGLFSQLFNGTGNLNIESSAASSDTVDAIWLASPNLDPWIKNVATSITNALRYDDPSPQPPSRQLIVPAPRRPIYDGKSYQLGIRVRWAWLALPVFCVVLSVAFLIVVMIKTTRSLTAPLKAGVLTFLFVEVDQFLKQRAASYINRALLKAVGDQQVFLKEDPGGKLSLKVA